jgi:hypothetical protein
MARIPRFTLFVLVLPVTAAVLQGCAYSQAHDARRQAEAINAQMAMSQDASEQRFQFQQEVINNPDLPAWREQREKMAMAIGDRTFDKGFDRVFDSMITALADLGCRVNNMERVSGYITASKPSLDPTRRATLRQEAMAQHASAKGYPPTVLTKQGPYDMDIDVGAMMESMGQGGIGGLTLTMVRQGTMQTKVKLRFDGVYYPQELATLYQLVWAEVDKQMFLDKALD